MNPLPANFDASLPVAELRTIRLEKGKLHPQHWLTEVATQAAPGSAEARLSSKRGRYAA